MTDIAMAEVAVTRATTAKAATTADLAAADGGLVPIADRLRYMLAFRLFAAAVAVVCWLAFPASRSMSGTALLLLTAGYVGISLATRMIWRLPRRQAVMLLGLSFLIDGVYIAVVAGGGSGTIAPARYLAVLDVIAVALLASFRTGLKLAVW